MLESVLDYAFDARPVKLKRLQPFFRVTEVRILRVKSEEVTILIYPSTEKSATILTPGVNRNEYNERRHLRYNCAQLRLSGSRRCLDIGERLIPEGSSP